MDKMSDRRRKKKKLEAKLSKFMRLLINPIKCRIPIPPPGSAFKSPKDYDRKQNKKIAKESIENDN